MQIRESENKKQNKTAEQVFCQKREKNAEKSFGLITYY